MSEEPTHRRPLLRVLRGDPDDAELAALTAVVAAAASATCVAPKPSRQSRWADRAASLHRELRPGPGAWWASGLPRC